MNPLVSICIPTFNGASYIKEAINSALNQTYDNIEIIISDDGSTDDTLTIIDSLTSNYKVPISVYNHHANGIGANWNNSVKNANGAYIKFLFQDDILAPTCVEKLVEVANKDQDIGLVYCKRTIIFSETNKAHQDWIKKYNLLHTHWEKLDVTKAKIAPGRHYMWDYHLLNEPLNKIGEPTATLISKSCFDKVGYFNETLKQALDIEFWFRLMPHYKFGFVNEELVSFRLHNEQASFKNQTESIDEVSMVISWLHRKYFAYLHPRLKMRKIVKAVKSRLLQIFGK